MPSEIVDNIHNYQRHTKPAEYDSVTGRKMTKKNNYIDPYAQEQIEKDVFNDGTQNGANLALERAKPPLIEKNIESAKNLLLKEHASRLIGLVAHLAYWSVFGQFNKLPLDMYHRK